MFDRTKFFVNPQHDSEGFTMSDAKCVGCAPDEMCPRSGHCERYNSPLRLAADYGPLEVRTMAWLMQGQQDKGDALRACYGGFEHPTGRSPNPPGWQELDGVKLPPITWAEVSDEELEQRFQAWLHQSTKPENLYAFRQRLRERVNAMVQRAQGIEKLSDSTAPDAYFGWKHG